MNRRKFTQGLGMLFTLPALPAKALASAVPVATSTVPNAARFWAIYMSQLHGTVNAATLANMTGITQSAAQTHLSSLIADGVITPQNLVQRALQTKAQSKVQTGVKKSKLDLREKLRNYMEPLEKPMDDTADVTEPDTIETDPSSGSDTV